MNLLKTKFYTALLAAFILLSGMQLSTNRCIVPAQTSVITASGGNTKVCPGTIKTYSIAGVSGATGYTWTIPLGSIIIGSTGNTMVTIKYTNAFTANDSLKVSAKNNCGTGPSRALFIQRNNPPAPTGAFTGPSTGFCGLSGVAYSVPPVAGITYNWSFDTTGAIITSGQGTNSITVDFTTSFVTGILGVTANNTCGTSGEHHLHLKSTPPIPDSLYGLTAVCVNQQGVPYSIDPVQSATSYTWTGPSGSHVSDGVNTSTGITLITDSTAVTVNYGSTTGILKVRGNNACGAGTQRTATISFVCRDASVGFENNFKVNCYPVPAKNELNISFISSASLKNSICIRDLIGKTLLSESNYSKEGNNLMSVDISAVGSGIYLLEVINGSQSKVQKIIIE